MSLSCKSVWDGNVAFFVRWNKSIPEFSASASFLNSADLLVNTLTFLGDMFFFSFLVVDKLKEMMEEIENAINAFKEEQRQTYVYTCFSYKKKSAFIIHNNNFASIK